LFEQALEKCPQKFCKPLFLMYAQLEEEHGLAKRAMNIYDRAATAVQDADKFDVSNFAACCLSKPPPGSNLHFALDVHGLHCQSNRQLRSPRHSAHLPACHRSLTGQADGGNVSPICSNGTKARRNRPCPSDLRARFAILRSENVSRVLEGVEFLRK
jgi:hypothetical protein